MIVVMDTNALMMPFMFKLNLTLELERLLGEYEVLIPRQVIDELQHLWKRKGNKRAKAALSLAKKFKVVDFGGRGDDAIILAAKRTRGCVLTNDSDLRKKLLGEGIPVIFLRSKTHLEIQGNTILEQL